LNNAARFKALQWAFNIHETVSLHKKFIYFFTLGITLFATSFPPE